MGLRAKDLNLSYMYLFHSEILNLQKCKREEKKRKKRKRKERKENCVRRESNPGPIQVVMWVFTNGKDRFYH